MNLRKSIFVFGIVCALLVSFAYAQIPTGKIIGKVKDDQGNPLPGVTIEAVGTRLVGSASAVTDDTGGYRLLAMPSGTYTIVFSLQNFKTFKREGIILQTEQTITLDATLEPSTLAEEVTVVGQTPLIDIKSTVRGATMNRQVFDALPKGRNFDSLLIGVPGVNDEDILAGTSVDGASGAENMYYVDGVNTSNLRTGASAQSVNYDFVEEVSFKSSGYNAEFGGSLGGVINVLTRSGGNEFHGEVMAYYQDEKLMGTRPVILDYNTADNKKTSYYTDEIYRGKDTWHNIEGGFNLGGYIIKDRLWFFTSFVPNYQYLSRRLDLNVQNTPVIRSVTTKQTNWNAQAKISTQLIKNLRLNASVVNNLAVVRGPGLRVGLGLPLNAMPNSYTASAVADYDSLGYNYPNFSASVMADLVVSTDFLVSLRGGFFKTNQNNQLPRPAGEPYYWFAKDQPYGYDGTTNDIAAWPEIPANLRHGSGWQNYPPGNANDTLKVINQKYNANLDLSYFLTAGGEHAFKVGVQFIRQGEDESNIAVQPNILIGWDTNFEAYGVDYGRGKYGWYAVRGNAVTGPLGRFYDASSNQWALYIQDQWTIGGKLTLNLGVRTESEYLPSYSQEPIYKDLKPINFKFKDKISPRFGFTYDVFGDATLKVYGSFAIYQDVMKLYMAADALGGNKWKSAYYSLDDYDFTKIGVNDNYPGTHYLTLDHRTPVFDTIDPDMKPFSQRQISLGVEKKLTEDLGLSVRLVNNSVLQAIEDCAIYVPGQGEIYYYTNPGGPFIKEGFQNARDAGLLPTATPDVPKAKREYYAMNISLDKRLSHNWMFGFSYTLSKLKGNFSGLANADEPGRTFTGAGRNNPNGERAFDLWHLCYTKDLKPIDGPLPSDRPHQFKAYGSYLFPFGLTVGTVVQAMSGTPMTESWNVDSTTCYFPFGRGNLGRTPFLFAMNAYAEYTFKLGKSSLQFNLNVSNLLNTQTPTFFANAHYRSNITPGNDVLVNNPNWQVPSTAVVHPFYMKASAFYAPLQARLGVRFIF